MRIIDLQAIGTDPILDYQSTGAASASIGQGGGESQVHWLRFDPGGTIGPHPAGFAQLLLPIEGSGWAAGPDGDRQAIFRGRRGRTVLLDSWEKVGRRRTRGGPCDVALGMGRRAAWVAMTVATNRA